MQQSCEKKTDGGGSGFGGRKGGYLDMRLMDSKAAHPLFNGRISELDDQAIRVQVGGWLVKSLLRDPVSWITTEERCRGGGL